MSKSRKYFLSLILLMVSGIFSSNFAEKKEDQKEHFIVEIRQDERSIPVLEDIVQLKKDSFELVIQMDERAQQGILINVSKEDKAFQAFSKGKDWRQAFDEPGHFMGMAEYDGNPDKELVVRKEAAHYLYYSDKQNNRFNHVEDGQQKDWVTGVRTVEILTIYPEKDVVKIKDIEFNDLYLVFFLSDWTEDYLRHELQRYQLHIMFK